MITHVSTNECKAINYFRIAFVLLFLTGISVSGISFTYAKYSSEVDASDSAKVAKWNVEAEFSGTVINLVADEEFSDAYYAFSVSPNGTETSSEFSLELSMISDGKILDWPYGLIAKLTDGDGKDVGTGGSELISNDGYFDNVARFEAGSDEKLLYRLYLSADSTLPCGDITMNIGVIFEQSE